MKTCLLLLAVVSLCIAHPSLKKFFGRDPYVIGGENAVPHEFPWQLSLQYLHSSGEWRHTCGASLIESRYALTAAHCVDGRLNLKFRVVGGLHKRSDLSDATMVDVDLITMHERYNMGPGTYANDIAILRLSSEVKSTDVVKPAMIPSDTSLTFAGDTCIISGWGRDSGADTLPDTLQKGEVQILSNEQCQAKLSGAEIIPEHICLWDSGKDTGSCNGDSGGPLNCKINGVDAVVGVTSWGISIFGKCRPLFPSVYTRVSEYLDWIQKHTP